MNTDILHLQITGMKCENCAAAVRAALARVPGVKDVDVDLAAGTAAVIGNPEPTSLTGAAAAAGFAARVETR